MQMLDIPIFFFSRIAKRWSELGRFSGATSRQAFMISTSSNNESWNTIIRGTLGRTPVLILVLTTSCGCFAMAISGKDK